jgi:phospholipid/cholesterol/gamma-HCH transport system substrate-binding protein
MKRNAIETVLGAVVLVVAGIFLAFAYSTANIRSVQGYPIIADFVKVGGLTRGSDVRISGITVGTVTDQQLDPKTFNARVTMTIKPSVQLPTDTEASIVGEGLLGGKYVNLVPGQAKETIAAGGKVAKARDFQSLEDMVGQIIFLATQDPSKPDDPAAATAAPATPAATLPVNPPAIPKEAPQ